ncbi:MAG: radical SAM protein, partial [Candidatus Omnitrophica bacterium]|nr:radical SAM protein [Candidatus Omnitrophota bacterium]
MKAKDKIACLGSIVRCRFLKQRIPLAVRWQLTNRCTLRCRYCKVWQTPGKEPGFDTVRRGIDVLTELGMKRISLSGGEVLLRDDIDEIVRYAVSKKIYPEMNTNGTLVKKKIDVVKQLDYLKISFDGPETVHDHLRGKGSYRGVMEAAEECRRQGVAFGFATTLTKYNIGSLGEILDAAKRFNTIVAFQPLKQLYRGVDDISEMAPEAGPYKEAVTRLLAAKLSGNKNIRNSVRGLRHIYHWPRYERLTCYAGKIFCIIDTNGDICPCD